MPVSDAKQAGRSGGIVPGHDRQGVPYETQGGGESDGTKSMRGLELRCYEMNRTWGMRPQGYGKGQ